MPLYVADYLADTAHLTTIEHGAYLLLIMHYWVKGKLPDDEEAIRRITRLSPHQWAKYSASLRANFFDGWKHKRIESELAKCLEISRVNSANAQRRHCERTANALRSDTHSHSHSHLTKKERKNGANAPTLPQVLGTAMIVDFPEVYAFEQGVIRLVQKDFDNWTKAFPNINLRAELTALSGWDKLTKKSWFNAVSSALAKKDREAIDRQKAIKVGVEAGVKKPQATVW